MIHDETIRALAAEFGSAAGQDAGAKVEHIVHPSKLIDMACSIDVSMPRLRIHGPETDETPLQYVERVATATEAWAKKVRSVREKIVAALDEAWPV